MAPSTIARVLRDNSIKPAPDRPTSWRTFLEAHWAATAALDFFTPEVWTRLGLMTYYVLFVIDLKSRKVPFAGATPNPNEPFRKDFGQHNGGFEPVWRQDDCFWVVTYGRQFRPRDSLGD